MKPIESGMIPQTPWLIGASCLSLSLRESSRANMRWLDFVEERRRTNWNWEDFIMQEEPQKSVWIFDPPPFRWERDSVLISTKEGEEEGSHRGRRRRLRRRHMPLPLLQCRSNKCPTRQLSGVGV